MDSQNIQSILQAALESELPASQIQLWPAVKASLVERKHSSFQQGEKMNTIKPRRISRVAFAALVIVTLLAIVFITPQGRAFAQRMFQFFAITDEKSFPIPTEQVFPVPETSTPPLTQLLPLEPVQVSQPTPSATPDLSCSTPASQATYLCQIKAAEAQAGFDAKEFLFDPKGLKFSKAGFNPNTGEISMEFEVITGGGYLYLRQGMADFPVETDTWGKVPSEAVEQVSVNGLYAEIASGAFVVYPNATSATWERNAAQWSLVWRDGNRWFALEKMGDPYPIEWITKDELIKLAESLVDARPADVAPPLDPEYLSTVEQAEALAGFHIPTPTLLPVGYELKRVVWMYDVVRLLYGPKDSSDSELVISLGQITNLQSGPCMECPPGTSETVQVGPWQGWYWRGVLNMGAGANVQPTPTPVWEADAKYWTLAWNTDTLWLAMNYGPSFSSGKEMNKETLIKIAESLK